MSVQLQMFSQETCEDSHNATSSQASADGVTPCNSLAGLNQSRSGREAARANRLVSAALKRAQMIRATCGRLSLGSLESVALERSLANKLKLRFNSDGLTKFSQTWRRRITPAGRVFWEHIASASIKYGSASIGAAIPTPTACDSKGSGTPRPNRGPGNNLRDWFRHHYGFLYPPAAAVGYLMGYPREWFNSAVTAMQSSRKSRLSSSARISTP